jgi:hypothetical protein
MATKGIRLPSLDAVTPGEARLRAVIPAFILLGRLSVTLAFRGRKHGET